LPCCSPVEEALGALTKHLYQRTSKLSKIITACHNESLHQHYKNYQQANHSICCFCGSAELSQFRHGIDTKNQWRSDFDHLLAQKHYPLYAVHPDNLVPTCGICNSKAKHEDDLLASSGKRRRSFYPYSECACSFVSMSIRADELGLSIDVLFDPAQNEKLKTWDNVYHIRERVQGKFKNLVTIVASDCAPDDLADLKNQISRKCRPESLKPTAEPWNIWKKYVYQWLDAHSADPVIELLWESIEAKRRDEDCQDTFGV